MSSSAFAQRLNSPALDPDYVKLEPRESRVGKWGYDELGRYIQNVGPFLSTDQQSSIFVWNLAKDTWGKEGSSLFSTTNFRLSDRPSTTRAWGGRYAVQRNNNGSSEWLFGPGIFAYPREGSGFSDTIAYRLYGMYNDTLIPSSEDAYCVDFFQSHERADIVHLRRDYERTFVSIWGGDRFGYKGAVANSVPVIFADTTFLFDGFELTAPTCVDIDQDGVFDILCRPGTSSEVYPGALVVLFGKIVGKRWEVDTLKYIRPDGLRVSGLLVMDFLKSDGIPDLLLTVGDTIYCFGGRPGLLRAPLQLSDALLKIPSPAKLDPFTFKGGGRGRLYDWGSHLFDAGSFNGAGDHMLGTNADLLPDTNDIFFITDLLMLYSGGKAADEKIDAFYGDNGTYNGPFNAYDTLQLQPGVPSSLLAAQSDYYRGFGKVYLFAGSTSIPHKPDARWSSEVGREHLLSGSGMITLELSANPFSSRSTVYLPEHGMPGRLEIRNLLGSLIWQQQVFPNQPFAELDLSGQAEGTYVLSFVSGSVVGRTKLVVIH